MASFRPLPILVLLVIAGMAISFLGSAQIAERLFPWTDFNIDVWFDADMPRVLRNMTIREEFHWTLYKHPLFSIIFWPLTSVVRIFGPDPLLAVRIVTTINAGLAVALLWALLARLGLAVIDRVLVTLLFFASATMIFWFTVPETFTFGMTTLLLALHVAITPPPKTVLGYIAHGLVSLATLSVTITNWAAGLLATALSYGLIDHPIQLLRKWFGNLRTAWDDLKAPVGLSLAVLLVAMALAVLQDMLFGEASLFFNISQWLLENRFIGEYTASSFDQRIGVLLTSPVVIGTLNTWHGGTQLLSCPATECLGADNFVPSGWVGLAAFVLWCVILAYAIFAALRAVFTKATSTPLKRLAIMALVMLGVERLRAWVMLMVAVDTGASRPEHLAAALTRARMCELLATTARVRRDVAFTAGLLSRFDVVLGVPLGQVLEGLPLSTELSGALLEGSGPLGALLGAVQAYETGDAHTSGLRGMTGAYLEAVAWTRQAIPLAASVR